MINDTGAKSLMASILKQAYDDYTKDKSCPEWCPFKGECETKKIDKQACDAKNFIHSAWCATLCDELGLDVEEYIKTCIEKHRLSKNIYKYIEGEIRSYRNTKKEIENIKMDIITKPPKPEEIRGTDIGDSTANKALKISMDRKILEMQQTVRGIEKVHKTLSNNKKVVMENYWNNQYTNFGIAQRLGVEERTVRRWKQQIVYTVAIELKYL